MMVTIDAWPEVEFAYNVRAGTDYVIAVIGYHSEDDYQRLIGDPDGPFARAAAEHEIEKYATWVWSERGPMERLVSGFDDET